MGLNSDLDAESLPPESLDGSDAENFCPSPLDFLGDFDDWTPSHDPNIIHSAREAKDFIASRESERMREETRCKSETDLAKRRRTPSFSILSDALYMDDIKCHSLYRRKLRAALGLLDDTSMADLPTTSAENLDTSLTFRAPHKRTKEQLHTRIRRVLSSVSINDSLFSEPSDNDTNTKVARYRNRHKGQRIHSRTKSMPSDVNEFIQSFNSNCNNSRPCYERSKSAEVLNHLGKRSAFSLYSEEVDDTEKPPQSEEDEIFIDSPLVVDYQLGRRRNLPTTPSTSISSEEDQSLALQNEVDSFLGEKDYHDKEVKDALQIPPSTLPQATRVIADIPAETGRSSIVHASPIFLGTPCSLLTEQKQLSTNSFSQVTSRQFVSTILHAKLIQ
ncbi:uncharacterized protein [Watersipora subatra]|uniref:uncharacterized protein n=1 Tax=Watersipora subatra TaxID=2589382 RepID=UPI00355B86CB